jgi:RNA polymerase sigma-70 factor, ECF subfamily
MDTNELELFERIRQGDKQAFETLFRLYYKSLCVFSHRIVKDAVTAEELIQDILYHLWDKRSSLILNTSLKSYLFKSAYNNSLKHIRHQKIVLEHENYVKNSPEPGIQQPDNYAETGEIMHIIDQTLNQVAERSQEIFKLNRYEGLKYHEIAEKLGISVKTVEAHMTSLLRLFRENLKDYLVVLFILFVSIIG